MLASLGTPGAPDGPARIENCPYAALERDADGWRLAADLTIRRREA